MQDTEEQKLTLKINAIIFLLTALKIDQKSVGYTEQSQLLYVPHEALERFGSSSIPLHVSEHCLECLTSFFKYIWFYEIYTYECWRHQIHHGHMRNTKEVRMQKGIAYTLLHLIVTLRLHLLER